MYGPTQMLCPPQQSWRVLTTAPLYLTTVLLYLTTVRGCMCVGRCVLTTHYCAWAGGTKGSSWTNPQTAAHPMMYDM